MLQLIHKSSGLGHTESNAHTLAWGCSKKQDLYHLQNISQYRSNMGFPLRLQSLLDRCESGIPLWDLCCDHGYLGLKALSSGRFTEVIFNDSVPHVLDDLRTRLPVGLQCRVILGNAEQLTETLLGNVVVAGIGGEKTHRILTTLIQAGRMQARQLVLCPEKDIEWFATQPLPGYKLREKSVIPHNQTTRSIFCFSAGWIGLKGAKKMGPCRKGPMLKSKWIGLFFLH